MSSTMSASESNQQVQAAEQREYGPDVPLGVRLEHEQFLLRAS